MKKCICALLAFVLCLTSVMALAEFTPSKTANDLTRIEATAENVPEGEGFIVRVIAADEEAYQEQIAACEAELVNLAAAESVDTYFGEEVDLKAMLNTETLNVYEFAPFTAAGYDASYGNVTAKMLFSTPYKAGQKVVVMIGILVENEDGTTTIVWTPFEGIGIETDDLEAVGSIQVELDPDTVLAVQNGTAFIAIVSE